MAAATAAAAAAAAKMSNQQGIHRSVKRRRTSDEMSKALGVIQEKRAKLHTNPDDEHVEVLVDAVNELLAHRQLNADLVQALSGLSQKAAEVFKNI